MQPPAYRAEAEDGGLVGEKRKRKETGENVKKTRRKGKEKKRDWSITSLRYIGTSLQCVWCARNHACTHGCTPSRTHARTHAPHFLRCDKVVFFPLFPRFTFSCAPSRIGSAIVHDTVPSASPTGIQDDPPDLVVHDPGTSSTSTKRKYLRRYIRVFYLTSKLISTHSCGIPIELKAISQKKKQKTTMCRHRRDFKGFSTLSNC